MSSKLPCKICGLENPEPSHFWRTHKIKESEYYIQYYNKKSLLTGEPIVFKNRDQYIFSDFADKHELKKYLKQSVPNEQKKYLKEILIRRKEHKDLIYTPTQVELRSTDGMVGVKTYNDIMGSYYKLCAEIGFKSKGFNDIGRNTILKKIKTIQDNMILVDSREQSVLNFKNMDIEIVTLPYGDYTIKNNDSNIFIERKSLSDFLGTMSKGLERFKDELNRAKENGGYIIMLVETNLADTLSFEYKPFINKHTKATAPFIFHNVRGLLQNFTNFQVAFCNGRPEMARIIKLIFEYGDFFKIHDLQLAIDYKLFNEGI